MGPKVLVIKSSKSKLIGLSSLLSSSWARQTWVSRASCLSVVIKRLSWRWIGAQRWTVARASPRLWTARSNSARCSLRNPEQRIGNASEEDDEEAETHMMSYELVISDMWPVEHINNVTDSKTMNLHLHRMNAKQTL